MIKLLWTYSMEDLSLEWSFAIRICNLIVNYKGGYCMLQGAVIFYESTFSVYCSFRKFWLPWKWFLKYENINRTSLTLHISWQWLCGIIPPEQFVVLKWTEMHAMYVCFLLFCYIFFSPVFCLAAHRSRNFVKRNIVNYCETDIAFSEERGRDFERQIFFQNESLNS